MFNLGRLDAIKGSDSFVNFANRLLELTAKKQGLSLDDLSEAEISNCGYTVYKKILNDFGLDKIFASISSKTKISYCLSDAAFLMALSHLLAPCSKLGTYKRKTRSLSENVNLFFPNTIYRLRYVFIYRI